MSKHNCKRGFMIYRFASILLFVCFTYAENIVYNKNVQHEIRYNKEGDTTRYVKCRTMKWNDPFLKDKKLCFAFNNVIF